MRVRVGGREQRGQRLHGTVAHSLVRRIASQRVRGALPVRQLPQRSRVPRERPPQPRLALIEQILCTKPSGGHTQGEPAQRLRTSQWRQRALEKERPIANDSLLVA